MAVVIDSGPIEATRPLRLVPRDQWRNLMIKRRFYLETNLPHDCRCLVEFVADAEQMHAEVGYKTTDEMISDGLGLKPDEIRLAVDWLKLTNPGEPIPVDVAVRLGKKYQALDAETPDLMEHGGARQVGNKKSVTNLNDASYALARLRRDRPDIHARVLAGELTAHAGMVEAGFRKKPKRKPPATPLERIRKLWAKLDKTDRMAHLEWTLKQCATCGREGRWMLADGSDDPDGMWCDACMDEMPNPP
jgi:hypothetical protein